MTNVQNYLKVVIGILAFFPGIAVYLELVEAPPDFVGAAKIISFSIAVMALVCVPLFADRIMSLNKRKVAILAVFAVVLGGASLMGYVAFAKSYIVTGTTDAGPKKFIIPLFPNARTQEIVDMMGTRGAPQARYTRAIESGEGPELIANLNSDSWDSFALMVVLLILSQVLLVVPPVAAVWRLSPEGPPDPGAAAKADKASA
jgi:hypothetical protein